jgi:regulation of enolase protein 1 (concanavalin A-like superfamily)
MQHSTRRSFLTQSAVFAGGSILVNSSFLSSAAAEEKPALDLIPQMTWMNDPASWKQQDGKLVVTSRPKTDFWRKTVSGTVVDNGHFFHLPAAGDFTFEARVNAHYAALYDQAGLMVRVDAGNWVKCGTEFLDGMRQASVVFTRDFSDGSTMNDLSQDAPVWWRVVRTRDALETLCSLDGQKYISVRQGYLVPAAKAEVGIMCAAPEGGGFASVFDNLRLLPTAKQP